MKYTTTLLVFLVGFSLTVACKKASQQKDETLSTPTPTATPFATPTPDDTNSCNPAYKPDEWNYLSDDPIVRYTVRPHYVRIGDDIFTPVQQGNAWVVPRNGLMFIDSFQKDARNKLAKWCTNPVWHVEGDLGAFQNLQPSSSNPFLFRIRWGGPGTITVWAEIDGVVASPITVRGE